MTDLDKELSKFLMQYFKEDLMKDDIESLVFKFTHKLDSDQEKILQGILSKVNTFGKYCFYPDIRYSILYGYFLRYLDINIFNYHIPDDDIRFYIDAADLYSNIMISIPKDINQQINFMCFQSSTSRIFNIKYDNSITILPKNIRIDYDIGHHVDNLNIYLPDNLSGDLKLLDIFYSIPSKNTRDHVKIYFKPITDGDNIRTNFKVNGLEKPILEKMLQPKNN